MDELNVQEKAATHVGETHGSLSSLLCNEERDFLIRNNGDKVKVEELEGKYVGLYFSCHWCPPCRHFTPVLSEIYKTLSEKEDFEIVFISVDRDEKSFEEYHHTKPWLALPFSDKDTRKKLNQAFQVDGIPCLVVLDKEGRVITTEGVDIIVEYGVEGYPFTAERLGELRAKNEALRAAQTVESLLLSDERDFVLGHGGRNVPVAELVGKTVGLYFSAHWCGTCRNFTQLVEIYNELLERGEAFEIVFLSGDKGEKDFEEYYAGMPWLALPFGDNAEKHLSRYFRVQGIPTLIILSPEGKTVQTEAVDLIREYGIRAYPFTKERMDELEAEEKAKRDAQTLESLLVSDERDFVIKHGGAQVPVAELARKKTVALYFSAHWCPPCRGFTRKLVNVYNELKESGKAFEIIFISRDKDQEAFEDYYKSMPWLALPFGDQTKDDLSRLFRVRGIPSLAVVGRDGKTVTDNARSAVSSFGAKAYPFSDAHLEGLKIKIEKHEHSLVLMTQRTEFICDGCNQLGDLWSYYCKYCDYDLHLACARKEQQDLKQDKGQDTDAAN